MWKLKWNGQLPRKTEISKMTSKEGENLNRPITITEIQTVLGLFSHEKHSTSLVIREMQVKAAAWCHFTKPTNWQKSKCLMVPTVGEDTEMGSTQTLRMGMQIGTSALESRWSCSFPTNLQVSVSTLEKLLPGCTRRWALYFIHLFSQWLLSVSSITRPYAPDYCDIV